MAAWEVESVESLQARHANARRTVDYQARALNDAVRVERILAARVEWSLTRAGRLDPSIAGAQYDAGQEQP